MDVSHTVRQVKDGYVDEDELRIGIRGSCDVCELQDRSIPSVYYHKIEFIVADRPFLVAKLSRSFIPLNSFRIWEGFPAIL